MTVTEVQASQRVENQRASEGSGGAKAGQAAKNRQIADTIRSLNEGEGVGAGSELQFAVDRDTGQPLIRVVDRVTEEVITQIPREAALRLAEVLKTLTPGDRIA